jgi:hypothetical protein
MPLQKLNARVLIFNIQFARLKVIIAEVPVCMNEWTEPLLQQYATTVHPLDANRSNAFGEYRIFNFGEIENKIIHFNMKLNDPNDFIDTALFSILMA